MSELINESVSDGGDCRTAPATPGLLNSNTVNKTKFILIKDNSRGSSMGGFYILIVESS